MNEISKHDPYYAKKIDLRFPRCCRIIVKRLSDNPNYPLNKKLEIRGTAANTHCEPLLVDLLNPSSSDGFKKHQILPGTYCTVIIYSMLLYLFVTKLSNMKHIS